jgi:hypothetical protein
MASITAPQSPAGSACASDLPRAEFLALLARVRDLWGGHRHGRVALPQQPRALGVPVPDQGADPELVAFLGDVTEAVEPVDVDQQRRFAQPQLEDGDQALAPGQDLCLVAVLGEEVQHLVERPGGDVVEGWREHLRPPPAADPAADAWGRWLLWQPPIMGACKMD